MYSNEEGGVISSGICPSCFWEPGFDDNEFASANALRTIIDSIRSYRNSWSRQWCAEAESKPLNWNPELQLQTLYKIAPYVR